jgi:hypothetical protein
MPSPGWAASKSFTSYLAKRFLNENPAEIAIALILGILAHFRFACQK